MKLPCCRHPSQQWSAQKNDRLAARCTITQISQMTELKTYTNLRCISWWQCPYPCQAHCAEVKTGQSTLPEKSSRPVAEAPSARPNVTIPWCWDQPSRGYLATYKKPWNCHTGTWHPEAPKQWYQCPRWYASSNPAQISSPQTLTLDNHPTLCHGCVNAWTLTFDSCKTMACGATVVSPYSFWSCRRIGLVLPEACKGKSSFIHPFLSYNGVRGRRALPSVIPHTPYSALVPQTCIPA